MPNGIDLGPTAFTQWRAQRGCILRPVNIAKHANFRHVAMAILLWSMSKKTVSVKFHKIMSGDLITRPNGIGLCFTEKK